MELQEEYPKTYRNWTARLRSVLQLDGSLADEDRQLLAMAINSMADKACDLEDIVQRLLNEPHSPTEVGELLIALELTTEQIRGNSDVIDGKLYDIADRLKNVGEQSTDLPRKKSVPAGKSKRALPAAAMAAT